MKCNKFISTVFLATLISSVSPDSNEDSSNIENGENGHANLEAQSRFEQWKHQETVEKQLNEWKSYCLSLKSCK